MSCSIRYTRILAYIGSHSPSPTAQRPSYTSGGGARQRTSGGLAGQSIPRSATLAATNPLLLARLSSSAPAPSVLGGAAPLLAGGESTTRWREPRNRLFSTSSLAEEVHGSASSISTGVYLSNFLGASTAKFLSAFFFFQN